MLILSRKRGERIVIGDEIEVVVISIQADRVRLGFNAEGHIPIHREEVYARILAERDSSPGQLEEVAPRDLSFTTR